MRPTEQGVREKLSQKLEVAPTESIMKPSETRFSGEKPNGSYDRELRQTI
jgi:hypothetical protein